MIILFYILAALTSNNRMYEVKSLVSGKKDSIQETDYYSFHCFILWIRSRRIPFPLCYFFFVFGVLDLYFFYIFYRFLFLRHPKSEIIKWQETKSCPKAADGYLSRFLWLFFHTSVHYVKSFWFYFIEYFIYIVCGMHF